MLDSNFVATLPSEEENKEVDHLISLKSDSTGRKIFLAYTVRIPWVKRDGKPLTPSDQTCYLSIEKKKL